MQTRGEFFGFDPYTGLAEYVEMGSDGLIHLHTYQDVQPVMDYAKALANEGITDGNFRGEGWHYAIIPAILQAALYKKGVNIHDPNDIKRVVHEINTNYPAFKTTHRHHAIK
jgi:hypothetical protein